MKKCYTCKTTKPAESFNRNKARKDGLNSICSSCSKEHSKLYYRSNLEKHKTVTRLRNKKQRHRNQQFVLSYLNEHPCVDCGERDLVVLDFDHIQGKSHAISIMVRNGYSLKSIMKEIEKCQVRCANCHRRKTAKDFNWYRLPD